MNNKKSVFDGLLKKNLVFSSGLLTAICAVCCDRFTKALFIIIPFSFITIVSSVLTTIFFQKKNFMLQTAVCALLSSLCYIPSYMLAENISAKTVTEAGIYYPLLVIMSIWVYKVQRTDLNDEEELFLGIARLCIFVFGADISMLLVSVIREILSYGSIFGQVVISKPPAEQVSSPWAGIILIGIISGIIRFIVIGRSKNKQ